MQRFYTYSERSRAFGRDVEELLHVESSFTTTQLHHQLHPCLGIETCAEAFTASFPLPLTINEAAHQGIHCHTQAAISKSLFAASTFCTRHSNALASASDACKGSMP